MAEQNIEKSNRSLELCKRVVTTESFIAEAKEIYGNCYDYSKANYICNDKNELPDEVNSQKEIYDNQLTKYVDTEECKVAILNAFPIFLFDYFGKKIVSNREETDKT